MALKVLLCLSALAVLVQGGIVTAPLPYVAPYASSVSSQVTHHSVAAPYVATPSVVAVDVEPVQRVLSPIVASAPLII